MTDRMPGRASQSWCPSCNTPPGPDCGDIAKTPRQVRRKLQIDLRREVRDALHERQAE